MTTSNMMKYLLSLANGHGRLDRARWLFRLIWLGLTCTAFGMLFLYLVGSAGATFWALLFLWCAGAISSQRLHDVGYSSWMLLIFLIPVFGPLFIMVQLLRRGSTASNKFGAACVTGRDYLQVDVSKN